MIIIFFSFISYNQRCYSVNGDKKYAFEFFHYFGCVIRGTNSFPFTGVWVHSRFLVESVLLIGLVLRCFLIWFLFVFVLCLVYPMLPVSLDCPSLIAPSVFSNVYLLVMTNVIFLVICFMFQHIRLVIRHIRFHIWPYFSLEIFDSTILPRLPCFRYDINIIGNSIFTITREPERERQIYDRKPESLINNTIVTQWIPIINVISSTNIPKI